MYSFRCKKCGIFEVRQLISEYNGSAKCPRCNKKSTERALDIDITPDTFGYVNKSDDECTLGTLAERNAKRYSDEYKNELTKKNNAYKKRTKELPKGMSRIKKE